MKIYIKKRKNGAWGIYKDGKLIDEETTKDKALGAAKFYGRYFKGNVSEDFASKRYKRQLTNQKMSISDPLGLGIN